MAVLSRPGWNLPSPASASRALGRHVCALRWPSSPFPLLLPGLLGTALGSAFPVGFQNRQYERLAQYPWSRGPKTDRGPQFTNMHSMIPGP